jgi:hypothetical protein
MTIDIDFSWEKERIASSFCEAANTISAEYCRPSAVFRPRLSLDGNGWIACLGDDLQVGVVGTGRSPHEAMMDFDASWYAKQPAAMPLPNPPTERIE